MYRGLLWVAFAVDECRRACSRLSSRLGKLESRLDLLENDPRRTVAPEPAPTPATAPVAAPEPHDRGRMDALETRVRQLEHVPLSLANLQRAVDELGSAEPPEPEAAAPTPAADEDAGGLELEGVYQELDRVAEFVAARVESLERALLQAATSPAANGHDDAEHRLRGLEARMERFERLYTAMQAGLELATT
jgi:hypothetical protein